VIPAPPLYPDELLSGALARCCRWFDISMRKLEARVLKAGHTETRFLGMSLLHEAAELFSITPQHLLWNHTVFPYATAFYSAEHYERELRDVMSPTGTRMYQGRVHLVGTGLRRICAQCLAEDLAQFGESYWHRSHNLPGVFFCVKHRYLLQQTSLRAAARRTSSALPINCELVDAPTWSCPGALEMAAASEALSARAPGPGVQRTPSFYRALAIERGYLDEGREFRQQALVDLFSKCFPPAFLREVSAEFGRSQPWPVLALNSKRGMSLSPLRHLMVEVALQHGKPVRGLLNHIPKGRSAPDPMLLDEKLAHAAATELKRLEAEGQRINLGPFLQLVGATRHWKYQKNEYPKLVQAVGRLQAWNRRCPKAAPAQKRDWSRTDTDLAAAAQTELHAIIASGQPMPLRCLLQRAGAASTWKVHRSNLPQLGLVVERLLAWNKKQKAAMIRRRRLVLDDSLCAAAAAELQTAIAAGERLTLAILLKRIGGSVAWNQFPAELPKLALVLDRVRVWEESNRPRGKRRADQGTSSARGSSL